MSKIDSTYTTLAATFIIKKALNLVHFETYSQIPFKFFSTIFYDGKIGKVLRILYCRKKPSRFAFAAHGALKNLLLFQSYVIEAGVDGFKKIINSLFAKSVEYENDGRFVYLTNVSIALSPTSFIVTVFVIEIFEKVKLR